MTHVLLNNSIYTYEPRPLKVRVLQFPNHICIIDITYPLFTTASKTRSARLNRKKTSRGGRKDREKVKTGRVRKKRPLLSFASSSLAALAGGYPRNFPLPSPSHPAAARNQPFPLSYQPQPLIHTYITRRSILFHSIYKYSLSFYNINMYLGMLLAMLASSSSGRRTWWLLPRRRVVYNT